ncbi:putative TetR family transcriptional regulator [Nocardia brasiliensis NBRC 14402]|uniref:TetR/AcrR family transcriptional regulator n=1 Tax=Nocardia brasiliensis TaxID=37326 RepID=UPI0002DF7EF2|nr:TetR/AcrR family transcriptional regulator C-terminal domain-containing protein [Nocardia brasiliensis]ASF08267.1 TetR/AcrR family transcriptional regulator [Nocardia brasiliensis]GAJ79936.1 putative TetR family transcriptional regulator [Nocardia brasiliensis NBRC 14402]SUB41281.1 Tetracycline repressor protein class E [Nocardia brasiliensis]
MATKKQRAERRTDALSKQRIVEAAVALLDTTGESGLTFRALAERLATGAGAIYWHVANKDELLAAATEAVVAAALAVEPSGPPSTPQDEIRAVALGLFDAIDEHPWLATQLALHLSRAPMGPVTPRLFERIGRPVRALGTPESSWFTATSVLVHYILGALGQNSASARALGPATDRARFLDTVATAWENLDPDEYPFTRAIAEQARQHDDREQFSTGIDLVLRGIAAIS